VIYTDFSKAFDRLDHNILLSKLHGFGFSASLLTFFKSKVGLTPRQQLATCCLQHILVMLAVITKKCCRQYVANCCLGVRPPLLN
jgi:hypothetical protein